MQKNKYIPLVFSIMLPVLLGAVIIAMLGYNPVMAYANLVKGAFVGKLNFGTTLEKFVPILLTGLAYCVSTKVKFFNLGTEGSLYIGSLFAAAIGYQIAGVPWYLHIPLCLVTGFIMGALWSSIAVLLRICFDVNEACVTIMLNYVAIYFTSFMCNKVWSAQSSAAQTPTMLESSRLFKFLKPSRANIGIIIAFVVFLFVYWLVEKSKVGYSIRSTGINPYFTDYIGKNSKMIVLKAVLLSGGIAGLAGAIEVTGLYGYFMDEFAVGIAFDGMLASLIAKNNLKTLPLTAFFMAALKAGALGMERTTGIPKALIDALIAFFIMLVVMDEMFSLSRFTRRKGKSSAKAKEVA